MSTNVHINFHGRPTVVVREMTDFVTVDFRADGSEVAFYVSSDETEVMARRLFEAAAVLRRIHSKHEEPAPSPA